MKDNEKENSYGHVLKYTGIFGGVYGLNILIGLVRNKIVSSLLGPEGMGLVSLFNSVVNFVSQATNLGIPISAVRHVSELFDQGDEARIAHFVKVVRTWGFLTAVVGMLVCAMLGSVLSSYTFSWGNHTMHFIMLSPAVGLAAISGGELAILKGARRLRPLALIQIATVFLSLVITIPLYFFFGAKGIVPVIVLTALASMVVTVWHSYRIYPLRLSGARGLLGEGAGMIRLGVAFVVAGIMGSGAEMLVRAYLNVYGDLDVVGLYNAGFMITVTYASMVFSAMESDYFPRLSGVQHDREAMTFMVNRQIEVSFLLAAPLLTLLIVVLPVIVPLLFTPKFMPVVPMAQVAAFSMYVKSVSLPMAYTVLAKGDSKVYMLTEAFYYTMLVVLVVVGYSRWGLVGTGMALSLSYLIELFVVYGYTHLRYGYVVSSPVVRYVGMQLPLALAAYAMTFVGQPVVYWTAGLLLSAASFAISITIFYRKTSLWNAMTRRLTSLCTRHRKG